MTKRELRSLPHDLRGQTIEQLQELHSEMLATCSDLGFEPSEVYLVTIETAAAGCTICKGLHEQIVEFQQKAGNPQDEKKPVADVPAKKDTVSAKKNARKGIEKTPAQLMAEQKAARLARDAAESSEGGKPSDQSKGKKVAKKAAKKKVAKKVANKKSGAKRSKFDPASKIHWIRTKEGNGAREGTPRHERREALRKANGQTVATYLKNGGKPATLARAVKDKDARVEPKAA